MTESKPFGLSEMLAKASRKNVETTLVACDLFRDWHRENFVIKAPTVEQMAEHAMTVRQLLMMLRWLQATLVDPLTVIGGLTV